MVVDTMSQCILFTLSRIEIEVGGRERVYCGYTYQSEKCYSAVVKTFIESRRLSSFVVAAFFSTL